MSRLVLLIAFLAMCSANEITGRIKDGALKGVGDILHPIEELASEALSSKCDDLKKLFRLSYKNVKGKKEPEVDQLTLIYRVPGIVTTYNITTAAELIPESQEFDPEKKLCIIIHGFNANPSQKNFQIVNEALMSQGQCNVLALDCSALIENLLYLHSSTYVRFIGEKLGEVLAAMSNNGLDPSDIHIIGHSLGAHISGFAGKQFANLTGYNVSRITGLDPAGPCFTELDPELRLKASDADFVDVIHSNAGILGMEDPIGHVDYFPNGGSLQPHCSSSLKQTVSPSCSHSRSVQLFAESVTTPDAFLAVKCENYEAFKKGECESDISPMGFASEPGTTGCYYLQTRGDSPFGLGKTGLTWKKDEGFFRKIGSDVKDFFGRKSD